MRYVTDVVCAMCGGVIRGFAVLGIGVLGIGVLREEFYA